MPKKNALALPNEVFRQKATPIEITSKDLLMFQCKCGNVHFRHAGYIEILIPFVLADRQKKMAEDSQNVMVCTKCKKCYIWYADQMYEVTKLIDLKAWEKIERKMQKATGPGGNC